MKIEKDLICISCPIGCRLKVTGTPEDLKVSGNSCEKGLTYAHDEITNPTRMICTTVKIKGGIHKVIPVKTDKPIPEKYKLEVVKAVNKIELTSPVTMGDIIIPNLFETGVNIVAERDM
jgi:CxxC motif-containing protein